MLPLLQTRLFVPPLPPRMVARPRLLAMLDTGLPVGGGRRMTLLRAPAGFGKTSLAQQWLQTQSHPVAWLSLAGEPLDAPHFLAYICAALTPFVPGLAALQAPLATPQQDGHQALLRQLVNQLAALDRAVTLVIDDLHYLPDAVAATVLTFLLEHAPPNFHLLCLTRQKPPLSLARLRARQQLTELNTSALRFTAVETERFVTDHMPGQLGPEALTLLDARTEGWVTGLQLVALSLPAGATDADVLELVGGTQPHILAYLVEEVLSRQEPVLQQFMLQLSLLSEFDAGLAEAVTGRSDAASLLQQLVTRNLFLVPLDATGHAYRFHHLFAEFLQARIAQLEPDQVIQIQAAASRYHLTHDAPETAVQLALTAGAVDVAAAGIRRAADAVWMRGQPERLRQWLDALPHAVVAADPILSLYAAWSRFFRASMGDPSEVAKSLAWLQQAETAAAETSEAQAIRGIANAMRAAFASMQQQLPETLRLGALALDELPLDAMLWRGVVSVSLGFAHQFTGDPTTAIEHFETAFTQSGQAGNLSGALFACQNLSQLLRQQADLNRAQSVLQRGLALAQAHDALALPICGQLFAGLARLHWLHYALADASDTVERAIDHNQAGGFRTAPLRWLKARILLAQTDAAWETVATQAAEVAAAEQAVSSPLPALDARWLSLASGNPRLVLNYAEAASAQQQMPAMKIEEALLLAAALVATGRLTDAAAQASAASTHPAIAPLQRLQLRVLALHWQDDPTIWQETLAAAAALDLYQPFLMLGPTLPQRCRDYIAQTTTAADAQTRSFVAQLVQLSGIATDTSALVEPLSEREREILTLIVAGHSNQEIADALFVALSTVKWHVGNIYGKLGVKRRSQAIQRAQSLL